MSSNEEIQKRIIDALERILGNRAIKCSICGNQSWEVGVDYVVLAASPHPTQTFFGGKVYPSVPIICKKCGNTHLINLMKLGFTTQDFDDMRYS